MATQPNELPSAKNAANIYTTDATPRTGPTDTPEAQHYPETSAESRQGASLALIFTLLIGFIILALVLWRVGVLASFF